MAIVISPSGLGSFNVCAYKYANSTFDIDPTATSHGTLGNVSAHAGIVKTKNKLGAWVRYYDKIINSRLDKKKQLDTSILKKGMFNLFQFFNDLSEKDGQVHQECKMEWPLDGLDNVWISGQPDVFIIYNKPEGDIVAEVFDIKVGKDSWYSSDDIWEENFQRVCYPYFIYKYFDEEINAMGIKNPKIKFSFVVMDKGTGEIGLHSKIVDYRFVELQLKTKVDEFVKYKTSDIPKNQYPAKECRACAFCDFKDSCPMTKALDKQKEIIDDLF